MEGSNASCLNVITSKSRRPFSLPWFRSIKANSMSCSCMVSRVPVSRGCSFGFLFLTFYPPADVKNKQCVRKDMKYFGLEIVQMSASLLTVLTIVILKKKKQQPIYFGDTSDEKKIEKKAFAGTE